MQERPLDASGITTETILVVEDNRLNQKVAILLLEKLGMTAEVAANGIEALKAMAEKPYSLILMDCHMPDMDGFQATMAIRQREAENGTYTPIIAVTALTTAGDRQRCLDAGMDDYIAKPIEKDLLKSKIDQWLLTAMAVHNPGSAALFRESIASAELIAPDDEAVNFGELKEFYGEVQLSQMLCSFISQSDARIAQLENYIREKNIQAVTILANELKKSCAAIGAKQLAKLCLYLQLATTKTDWIEAQETFSSIQRSFTKGRMLLQAGVKTEENPVIDF